MTNQGLSSMIGSVNPSSLSITGACKATLLNIRYNDWREGLSTEREGLFFDCLVSISYSFWALFCSLNPHLYHLSLWYVGPDHLDTYTSGP